MKSMEANMDALTNKIKQLKIREPNRKIYERNPSDKPVRCYECNKESHNCPNVKKRLCEIEHNNAMKGSIRPVRSINVQLVCKTNGSIGVGSSLEEAGLYIKDSVHGMHAKLGSTPDQHSHLCRRHCMREYHRKPGQDCKI